MIWFWVAVTVVSGSLGDLLSARGMARHGEIEHFRPSGVRRVLRYILTHRTVMAGIAANAVSFISFMALLSLADLSFAVPVTALGYILRTALARIYLREYVSAKRWAGAILVALGVLLVAF